MKIAVLLTTFNRKEKTISCLESLRRQQLPADVHIDIFLTDDASSDGTADAVKALFPDVYIFLGTGSLFWAGGMRKTWRHAIESKPDYYLLLNDDTKLNYKAIGTLVAHSQAMHQKNSKAAICIGTTIDDSTGKISYGGWKLRSKHTWKSYMVHSETAYLDCDFANANIMLVPHPVVRQIGILSDAYTHCLADYDYTLKAKKAGFQVVVAPGFLGTCVDDHGHNWKSQKTTLKERINYLKSPKGLAYKEYMKFIRDHFPLSYPTAFIKLWMKTFFPFIWDTFKK